jgi:hypothetical protein
LAHALGSLGEIARDEGLPEEALANFAEARALYERLPGASLEKLAVKLENEAEALATLGRAGEAQRLKARVAQLRGEAAPPASAIPLDRIAPERDEDFAARVVVELDGLHLPDEVYAQYDLAALERRLESRLEESGVGEVEGHLSGPETTEVHMVGSDAQALYQAIEPVLRDYPLCQGAQIRLHQGERISRFSLGRKSVN